MKKPKLAKKKKEKSTLPSSMEKINLWLEETRNQKLPYIPKNRFKASDLGSLCNRRIYYSYFHVDSDNGWEAKGIRIFDTGDAYEEMVMTWLKGIGEYIPYMNPDGSVPIHPATKKPDFQFPSDIIEWEIRSGRIDNVWVDELKRLWLYEIKSKKAEKWEGLRSPDREHKIQVGSYIFAMEKKLGEGKFKHIKELDGITEVFGVKIFYINKDTSEVKEFISEASEYYPVIAKLIDLMNEILEKTANKKLPDKTESGLCRYCPYWSKCAKEYNNVKTWEELKQEERENK